MKDEPSNISNVIPAENLHMIPVFASVSAGFGAYASDEILEYIPTVLTNPYEANITLGIKVTGNSMYPKIEDGDTIVVRKQESVDSGSIAVILLDGEEGLVKKVKYGDDWIDLISINPEYPVKHFEGSEVQRLRVVGLVRQVIKMV
ncbi:MAG: S24 family peptidase [Ruminiclostridium sp.]|nr:S24 family peptidase [Ruminiclostridium sp.]